ncbi:MAG TPA: VOC family protein [Candidatus Binataceae bacterium]|nr:VOC family protein [Candidatus Binataceae bacterium]
MEPLEIIGVEHVDLTVNDLKRSAGFYDKVFGALGFRRLEEDDAGEHDLRWGNAHLTIAIRAAATDQVGAEHNRYRVGLHHLALKARTRQQVDQFYRFLHSERITVLDAPAEYPQYGKGYYAVFFADPDGLKLEVVHFPWGYWRRVQADGHDERPRYAPR